MVMDGIASVLAYTALILAILCSIAEKWTYFSSLIDNDGTKVKKKKHKHKKKDKKKKSINNYDFISNEEFYKIMS